MKKQLSRIFISLAVMVLTHAAALAQPDTANISAQPAWGPAGYPHADYYYLPDVESYYSVASHQFIYLSDGRWVYAAGLPRQYKNYDLFSGYKVVVNSARPFLNFSQDKVQYNKFKGLKGTQQTLRDAHIKHAVADGNKKGTGDDFGP